jgi:hypothetical protein
VASKVDKPIAVSNAQVSVPAATPKANAKPEAQFTAIDVPITARTFGPGLAIAIKNAP